jgi:hypothetical protein
VAIFVKLFSCSDYISSRSNSSFLVKYKRSALMVYYETVKNCP